MRINWVCGGRYLASGYSFLLHTEAGGRRKRRNPFHSPSSSRAVLLLPVVTFDLSCVGTSVPLATAAKFVHLLGSSWVMQQGALNTVQNDLKVPWEITPARPLALPQVPHLGLWVLGSDSLQGKCCRLFTYRTRSFNSLWLFLRDSAALSGDRQHLYQLAQSHEPGTRCTSRFECVPPLSLVAKLSEALGN